jgi:hypothetical protein
MQDAMGKLLKFTLEDHLSECEARYQDLKTRLDNVDDRLYRLELLCLDIKNLVSNSQHKTS